MDNLSPERRAKWEASGEGEAFNAMVREKAKKLAEKMKAEQNGISGAMSNAVKSMQKRADANAEKLRKQRNERDEIMRVEREARMAEFAAMKPSGVRTPVNRASRLARVEEEEAAAVAAAAARKAARKAANNEDSRIIAKTLANKRAARGFGGSRKRKTRKTRKTRKHRR